MGEYRVTLNPDQEKIAAILAKVDGMTIEHLIQDEVIDYLEQIGHDVIHSYLDEQRNKIPTITEFREKGITEEDVAQAFEAEKNLGLKFKFDEK